MKVGILHKLSKVNSNSFIFNHLVIDIHLEQPRISYVLIICIHLEYFHLILFFLNTKKSERTIKKSDIQNKNITFLKNLIERISARTNHHHATFNQKDMTQVKFIIFKVTGILFPSTLYLGYILSKLETSATQSKYITIFI